MSIAYETEKAIERIRNRRQVRGWLLTALELLERNGLLGDGHIKCIDFGCSSCEFVEELRNRHGVKCVAADYPTVAVKFAEKLGFEAFQFDGCNVESLPSKYVNYADFVTCLATLEHITDLRSMFQLMNRSLKPRGYLCIAVPNSSSYKDYFQYMYTGSVAYEGHHFRFLNREKITNLIEENGFDVVDQQHSTVCTAKVLLAEQAWNWWLKALKQILLRLVWTKCWDINEESTCQHIDLRVMDWIFLLRKRD